LPKSMTERKNDTRKGVKQETCHPPSTELRGVSGSTAKRTAFKKGGSHFLSYDTHGGGVGKREARQTRTKRETRRGGPRKRKNSKGVDTVAVTFRGKVGSRVGCRETEKMVKEVGHLGQPPGEERCKDRPPDYEDLTAGK